VVTETDIANLAIGLLGAADRIAAGAFRTEDSHNAATLRNNYDECRRSELRRNVWRFAIRTSALRPVGDFSKLVTFGAWAVGTTYAVNDVVLGSDGNIYFSLVASNLAHDPISSPTYWTLYFGSLLAQEYVMAWSASITYDIDDHTVGSDSQVYRSLVNTNLNNNPVGDGNVHWSLATVVDADDDTEADDEDYWSGEIVYVGRKVYLSKISSNDTDPGSSSWLLLTTTPSLVSPNFVYPIGAGPSGQVSTRNAYRLPNGFLRQAPEDPKQGSTLFLGAPSALAYRDWNLESDYLTTRDSGVILFRFSADLADTTKFDPMFIQGLAARLAYDNCEALTQSTAKKADAERAYKSYMTEARMVNGIETGPTEPPEDDYIRCRA
jgi:hypothetical protein